MFFGYCFCSLYALNKNWKELTLSQTSLSLYILAHSSVSRSPNFISCPRSPEAYIRRLVYLGRNRWLLYISANVVPKLANVWIYRRQSFQGLPESPNQRIVYRLWGEGWRIWVIFGFSDWQKRGSVIPESSRGVSLNVTCPLQNTWPISSPGPSPWKSSRRRPWGRGWHLTDGYFKWHSS